MTDRRLGTAMLLALLVVACGSEARPGQPVRGALIIAVPAEGHGISVPVTLLPAAQKTPPGLEYIARSTTIWAGDGPRLWMRAPTRLPSALGNSTPTGTVVRLLGGRA